MPTTAALQQGGVLQRPCIESDDRAPKSRGFNLIEAAIVLGVIGIIVGGIWIAASAVQTERMAKDYVTGFYMMNVNLRQLYSGQDTSNSTQVAGIAEKLGILNGAPGWSQGNIPGRVVAPNAKPASIRVENGGVVWDLTFASASECIKVITKMTQSSAVRGYTYGVSGLAAMVLNGSWIDSFPIIPGLTQCDPTSSPMVVFRF